MSQTEVQSEIYVMRKIKIAKFYAQSALLFKLFNYFNKVSF